jgi:hypothetical protein
LNDKSLGFTQHATKTLDDQRGESYYINMLSAYTDSLYNGHFLLSSILGCHPPLVGHSIFLRSDAVRQTGRIRTLRKAQRWLKNIGLPFLSVDQVRVLLRHFGIGSILIFGRVKCMCLMGVLVRRSARITSKTMERRSTGLKTTFRRISS